jgi:chorismate synthase
VSLDRESCGGDLTYGSKMTAESLRCELPASGRVKANAAAPASPKNKWQFEEKEILIVDHVISVWKEVSNHGKAQVEAQGARSIAETQMLPPMEDHEIGEYLFATKQKGSFGPCWKTSLARDVLVTVIGTSLFMLAQLSPRCPH